MSISLPAETKQRAKPEGAFPQQLGPDDHMSAIIEKEIRDDPRVDEAK
jgi:hypothetical protein